MALHHEEGAAVRGVPEVGHGGQVGVRQARLRLRLEAHPLQHPRVRGALALEQLDDDRLAERHVNGVVDLRGRPLPQLATRAIRAAGQRVGAERREGGGFGEHGSGQGTFAVPVPMDLRLHELSRMRLIFSGRTICHAAVAAEGPTGEQIDGPPKKDRIRGAPTAEINNTGPRRSQRAAPARCLPDAGPHPCGASAPFCLRGDAMGRPAAKQGDEVVGSDVHVLMVPSPAGPVRRRRRRCRSAEC